MAQTGIPTKFIVLAAQDSPLVAGTVKCLKKNGQPRSLIDALKTYEMK
jgi:hypothetical protein